MAHLKHKLTGELKEVPSESVEYQETIAERHPETGRTVWEDRGVAAHAELGIEPAVGNINDRNYNDPDTLPEVEREEGHEPSVVPVGDLELADERERHALARETPHSHSAKGDEKQSQDTGDTGDTGAHSGL